MVDFAKHRIRSRIEAKLLDAGAEDNHAAYGDRKQSAIGAMGGTVVEIGPGTGANMRYYAPGTKVIAIEPNPVMHEPLRAQGVEHGLDLEIRTLRGESIDVPDETADGVVGTLLLCGVDDAAAVIAEAYRIMKPGGTYFFVEHVVAPAGTRTHTVQRLVFRPHRWMFNGCEVNRDTGALLRSSEFVDVQFDDVDRGRRGLWARTQIVGTATKPA
jgi:SAM-dependent methyltransferase